MQSRNRIFAILILAVSIFWLLSSLRSLYNFYTIYFDLREGKICDASRVWIFWVNALIGLIGVFYVYLINKRRDRNWMKYLIVIFAFIAVMTKYYI